MWSFGQYIGAILIFDHEIYCCPDGDCILEIDYVVAIRAYEYLLLSGSKLLLVLQFIRSTLIYLGLGEESMCQFDNQQKK